MIKLAAATIRNTTNSTQAMWVAVPATPDNPNTPAINAMTRNVTAQLSILASLFRTCCPTSGMLATTLTARNRLNIAALIRTKLLPGRHRTGTWRMCALFFHEVLS
jgi:hypothetical protein